MSIESIDPSDSRNYMNSEYIYIIMDIKRPFTKLFMLRLENEMPLTDDNIDDKVYKESAKNDTFHLQLINHEQVDYIIAGIHQKHKKFAQKLAHDMGFSIFNGTPKHADRTSTKEVKLLPFPLNHSVDLTFTLVYNYIDRNTTILESRMMEMYEDECEHIKAYIKKMHEKELKLKLYEYENPPPHDGGIELLIDPKCEK